MAIKSRSETDKDALFEFFKRTLSYDNNDHFLYSVDTLFGYANERMRLIRGYIGSHDVYRRPSHYNRSFDEIKMLDEHGDIEAPVDEIRAMISPVTSGNNFTVSTNNIYSNLDKVDDYRNNILRNVVLLFEPKFTHDKTSFELLRKVPNTSKSSDIYFDILNFGSFQSHTILSSMHSVCRIDINNFFSILDFEFKSYACEKYKESLGEESNRFVELSTQFDRYSDASSDYGEEKKRLFNLGLKFFDHYFAGIQDETFVEDIMSRFERHYKKVALTTYLIYVGKLLAKKSDIYDWLYTTFVRDMADRIEEGAYPTSVGLDTIEQHPVMTNGMGIPIDRADPGSSTNGIGRMVSNDYDYRRIMFKNLRIKYSNWASVINLILGIQREDSKNNQKIFNVTDGTTSTIKNFRVDEDTIRLAREVLEKYISLYYRTYDIAFIGVGSNGRRVRNVGWYAKTAYDRIMDASVIEILESVDIKREDIKFNIQKNLIQYSNFNQSDIQYHKTEQYARKVFVELFQQLAYYILLDYLRMNDHAIPNETDPLTGTSKKALYRETQLSVVENIKKIFYANGHRYLKESPNQEPTFYSLMNLKLFEHFIYDDYAMTKPEKKLIEFTHSSRLIKEPFKSDIASMYRVNETDKYILNQAIKDLYILSPVTECISMYHLFKNFFDYSFEDNKSIMNELYEGKRMDKRSVDLHYQFPIDAVSSHVTESYQIIDPSQSHPHFKSLENAETILMKLQELSYENDSEEPKEISYSTHHSFTQVGDAISEITKDKTIDADGNVDETVSTKEVDDKDEKPKEDTVHIKYALEDAYNELFCEIVLGRSYESFLADKAISIEDAMAIDAYIANPEAFSQENGSLLENELADIAAEQSKESQYADFLNDL